MYNNSKKNILFPILLSLGVIAGILIGTYLIRRDPGRPSAPVANVPYSENKLLYTLSLIDRMYVDPVNLDSIAEQVMPMLMNELDPHSVYIPASEFAAANETLDGEFDGIGVLFNMSTDTAIVLNVIPGGPSVRAGIQNGDRIIKVDGKTVAGNKTDQNELVRMLKGKRGTKVDLSLQRTGISSLVPVTVTRGIIPLKSLTAAFMIQPGVAYLKLSAFSKTSQDEIVDALSRLRGEGMTKLILDLRGNTGGFLDQAIIIANDFLPSGKLIVYTEDRYQNRSEEFSNGRGQFADTQLAVLIDEGSASSSEILAGAIQDNDRGYVIGRRSFGKGLVQQQFSFRDGSALRLTIARYFTPTGRSIQKPYTEGSEGNREYRDDFRQRFEHNELFSADSIKFDDSLKFVTPGGRTVYGGGGIMPDIFVPLDTTGVSNYFREVAGRNILFRYTIDYSDRHREQLNNISTLAQLRELLDSDTGLLDDFIKYASSQGVAPVRRDIEESREVLTAQLRAYIGRNTSLEDNAFYDNIYTIDNTILKALEVLNE